MVERDQGFLTGHIKLEKFIRYPSREMEWPVG